MNRKQMKACIAVVVFTLTATVANADVTVVIESDPSESLLNHPSPVFAVSGYAGDADVVEVGPDAQFIAGTFLGVNTDGYNEYQLAVPDSVYLNNKVVVFVAESNQISDGSLLRTIVDIGSFLGIPPFRRDRLPRRPRCRPLTIDLSTATNQFGTGSNVGAAVKDLFSKLGYSAVCTGQCSGTQQCRCQGLKVNATAAGAGAVAGVVPLPDGTFRVNLIGGPNVEATAVCGCQ